MEATDPGAYEVATKPAKEAAEQSSVSGRVPAYKTGAPVKIGDVAHTSRGEAATAHGWALPRTPELAECS